MKYLMLLCFAALLSDMPAAEKAFPKTAVGVIEIKTLPPARLIAARTYGSYFDNSGRLFRPLFQYIQSNDIAMTSPVEAEIDPATMYFYIGTTHDDQALEATDGITIHHFPERRVASIGVRGGYSEANFRQAATELSAWLQTSDSFQADGPPRALYWNAPYVPSLFKRFEVHIPLAEAF